MCGIRKTDPDWGTHFDSRQQARNHGKCLLLREGWSLSAEQGDEWTHQVSPCGGLGFSWFDTEQSNKQQFLVPSMRWLPQLLSGCKCKYRERALASPLPCGKWMGPSSVHHPSPLICFISLCTMNFRLLFWSYCSKFWTLIKYTWQKSTDKF